MPSFKAFFVSIVFLFAGLPAAAQHGSGVPALSFAPNELFTPLRTFSTTEIGARPTFAGMHNGYLIVAGGGVGNEPRALTLWDIANPNAPTLVSSTVDNSIFKTHAMGFTGNLLSLRADGGAIYDISNPAAPVRRGTMGGTASSLWTYYAAPYIYKGGEGYGDASGWVTILDASDPDNIVVVNEINMPALVGFRCGSTHVLGNLLVVSASQTNGVVTFDISDPVNPVLLDVLRIPGDNTYTSLLNGNRLYSGGQDGGLHIYDLTDPSNIVHVGNMHPGGSPRYPMLQDEYIHLGNLGNDTYQKIDINRMQLVANAPLPGGPLSDPEIALPMGNLVFVGNSVLDVALPGGYLLAHDTAPDTQGLLVSAVRPVDNETQVASTTMIGVALSDQIDPRSVDSTSVIVRPVGGAAITGSYTTQTGTINFAPDQPLLANTTYEVVVTAGGLRDLAGNAVMVESLTRFSTGATIAGSAPIIPGALSASAVNNAQVDLLWSDNSGSETSFLIERKTASGPFLPLATVAANSTSYSDSTPTPFTSYSYRVRAQGDGNSVFSGPVSITTPGAGPNNNLLVHWPFNGNTTDVSGQGQVASLIGNTGFSVDAAVGSQALALDGDGDYIATDNFNLGAEFSISMWAKVNAGHSNIQTLVANTNGGAPANGFRLFVNEYLTTNGSIRFETRDGNLGDVAYTPAGTFAFDQWNHVAVTVDRTAGVVRIFYNGMDLTVDATTLSSFNVDSTLELGRMFGGFELLGGIDDLRIYDRILTPFDIALLADAELPLAPTALNATSPSASAIDLVWDDNSNNENEFLIERSEAGGPFVQVATVLADTRLYRDTGLLADSTYSYRVRSSNHNGNSAYSNQASATTSPGTAAPGLTAHWEMDSAANNQTSDVTGNGHDGSLFGGATLGADSVIGGQALALDGVNDYVDVGSFNLAERFTLAMWAKVDGNSQNIQTFAANVQGGLIPSGFRFFVNSYNTENGRIVFETGNDVSGDHAYSPEGTFAFDQWNHVAAVVDRIAGTVRLYYNGIDVTEDPTTLNDFNVNGSIHLGQMTAADWNLDGGLDDVRIYDRLLSAEEIAGLASPGSGGALSLQLTPATPGLNSLPIDIDIASITGGDGVLEYAWDFNDGSGSTPFLTSSAVTHTFSGPGHYTVQLTVRDQLGQQTSVNYQQLIHLPLTPSAPTRSSPIVYDTGRDQIWNVNPDNNSVMQSDAIALARLNEIAVGDRPRTLAVSPGGEVWVVNQGDASITVLNGDSGSVVQLLSLPRGSAPYGLSFAPSGSVAYVTLQATGQLIEIDAANKTILRSVDVGPSPRGIAVTHDSTRIFVTRFIAPQSQGEVREIDASSFSVSAVHTLAKDQGPDTPSGGRGVPNYISAITISPDGGRAWVPAKKDNTDRGEFNDGLPLTFENTTRAIAAKIDLATGAEPITEQIAERIDFDNSSLPFAVQFSLLGDWAFVAMAGNNRVDVRDAYSGSSVTTLATGLTPQGLVLSPDGTRLFTHNFMQRSVSVFDISALSNGGTVSSTPLATIATVANEALAPTVLAGKQIFYNASDPRMSLDGYISCASCHLEGGQDGRVWDFTDRGEGLRNTIDMRGRAGIGHGNVHWTASFDEIQDFENDIRQSFAGTGFLDEAQFSLTSDPLATPKAGLNADLDALAAYVSSLAEIDNSPYRAADGSLTSGAEAGRAIFLAQGCSACHSGAVFSDGQRHDVGTIQASSGVGIGQPLAGVGFETPTLQGLWSGAPYLHNGQAQTLEDVLLIPGHGTASQLSSLERASLVEYLLQIDSDGGPVPAGCDSGLFPGDSDCDSLPDSDEANAGTDPLNADTDSDGLIDGDEVNVYASDPNNPDTDDDGVNDGDEVNAGTLPTVADFNVPAMGGFGVAALMLALFALGARLQTFARYR